MDLSLILEKGKKLNVRSAALIRCGNEYLICKRENKDYYSLPGGRIKFGESSSECIIRELKEELGLELIPGDLSLARIVENHFSDADNKIHEYLFIYLIELDKKFNENGFKNLEDSTMDMKWIREEELVLVNLKPEIAKGILADSELKHMILKR